jgi:hypothetical protein
MIYFTAIVDVKPKQYQQRNIIAVGEDRCGGLITNSGINLLFLIKL